MNRIFTPEFWRAFWQHTVEIVTSRGLLILVILLGYWLARRIAYRVTDAALARMLARHRKGSSDEHANRLLTLQGLVRSLISYVLFFVLIIMLLDSIGANVMGIVTTAGVGGIAIGFGAQKLVRDIISGFFLIVEDQFVVGDYVNIGPATGVVEELGMRITRIRDDQGKLWILSNGDITAVTNFSRAPVEAAIEIGLAPTADVKKARKVITDAVTALFEEEKGHLQEAPTVAGVSGWDATHTTIRVILSTDPRSLYSEQVRVREAIFGRLSAAGIPVA